MMTMRFEPPLVIIHKSLQFCSGAAVILKILKILYGFSSYAYFRPMRCKLEIFIEANAIANNFVVGG